MTFSVGDKVRVTVTDSVFECRKGDEGEVKEMELRPTLRAPMKMALVDYGIGQDPAWVPVKGLEKVSE